MRRSYLDKIYKDNVAKLPQGSEARQRAETAFGALAQGVDAKDMSAAAFINGRWDLYKNQFNILNIYK